MEMEKKYELTNETLEIFGHTLHRIRALKYFSVAKPGDLGGWIESEENLSQSDFCWISDEAKVFGEARVSENAQIRDKAMIYDCAKIYGSGYVIGLAIVHCNSEIFDHAVIGDCAEIKGNSIIHDDSLVIGGSLIINSEIKEQWRINNAVVDRPIKDDDIEELIRIQTGLIPFSGKVIAYKQVAKDLTSFYDPEFHYVIGEYAEVQNPKISKDSCASGLHFSNANYWNLNQMPSDSVFLVAEINLEDIITVQAGKIRCKRALILGKHEVK